MVAKCLCAWNCMILHSFFPHPSLCLVTKMNLLKKSSCSFNLCKWLFPCLQRWFGEITSPELNRCSRIFSSTINWRKFFAEKKYNSNYSMLLNFAQLVMSLHWLGCAGQIDIGNVQYSLVRRLINYKLSDNKDIE